MAHAATDDPALDAHPRLRVLELRYFMPSPPMIDAIRRIVQNSPALQELRLYPDQWEHDELKPHLDAIVSGSTCKLLKLSISDHLKLQSSSVPFLHSLVHLSINSSIFNIDASFWTALAQAGVKLHHLAIYPPTVPLIQYLTSYGGLQVLLVHPGRQPTEIEMAQDHLASPLFQDVLPHHRDTLTQFSTGNLDADPWLITAENLEPILRCQNLQNLQLACYFFDHEGQIKKPSIDYSFLLSRVADLPCLQHLTLKPKWEIPWLGCNSGAYDRYMERMNTSFINKVCETEIILPSRTNSPEYLLHFEYKDTTLQFDTGNRQFRNTTTWSPRRS